MKISEYVYQNIIEQLTEGIYYVDKSRNITYWNRAAESITGYSREEVLSKSCADNILRHIDSDGNELCIDSCPLSKAVESGESHEKSIYLHHKKGHRVHVYTRVSPIYDDNNEIIGAVELFSDLTESSHCDLVTELEQLKKEVYVDSLTNTCNRKFSDLTLERRITDFKNHSIPFSIFFIDIDDFKQVNDIHGHDIGDRVLQMTANSISGLMRNVDVVCRWGGEEFIIISPNLTKKSVKKIGERIRFFIEKSWVHLEDSSTLSVTVSIGATTVLPDDTVDSILQRADQAMYESKLAGKNKFIIM